MTNTSKRITDLDIDKETAIELINLISDIGYDYISNPTDALNFTKQINLLKFEIHEHKRD
jgi:ribosomal protein S15P/S13E